MKTPPDNMRRPVPLWLVFVFGFVFSLVVIAGFTWALAAYETSSWLPWRAEPHLSQDKLFEIIRNAVTAGAALGVGVTLFFSYRRQQTAESTQRISAEAQKIAAEAQKTASAALELNNKQHALERERRDDSIVSELRSRYSKASEQMSGESLTLKLAGVYALATLAGDWNTRGSTAEMQTCIDLLLATHRSLDERESPYMSGKASQAPVREGIERSILDRFKAAGNDQGRWSGCYLELERFTPDPTMLSNLRIDAIFDVTGSRWATPLRVSRTAIEERGRLFLSGSKFEALEFESCSFDSGVLDLSFVDVQKRIMFFRCTFSGTKLIFNRSATGKNIEFVGCSFEAFPHLISPSSLTSKKIKFVGCEIDTQVMETFDYANKDLGSFMKRSLEIIVRECRFGGGVPVIESAKMSGYMAYFDDEEYRLSLLESESDSGETS